MGYLSQEYNPNSFLVKEDDKDFRLEQDVSVYKRYAELEREKDLHAPNGRRYKSFAIIPDIVAIDILTKYKIDIHSKEFMSDPVQLRKFKQIIMTDYPQLQTSNVRK